MAKMKQVEESNIQTQIMATASKFQTKGAASQYKFVELTQAKIKSAMLVLDTDLLSLPRSKTDKFRNEKTFF